jgi:hypothetical protein
MMLDFIQQKAGHRERSPPADEVEGPAFPSNIGLVAQPSVSPHAVQNPIIDTRPLPGFKKNGPQVMDPTTEHHGISTRQQQFSWYAIPISGTETRLPPPKTPQILGFTALDAPPEERT